MRTWAVGLLVVAVSILRLFVNSPAPAEEKPPVHAAAPPEKQPAPKIRFSDKAVVKDVVYGLEEQDNELYLTSQPLNGEERQIERGKLKFAVPPGAIISELSLDRMDGKNLMAVVKVSQGQRHDFYCLTFIGVWGGHIREKYAFYKAKFHTTGEDLKILAIGGKQFEGSAFVVLGDITHDESKDKEFVTVTKGVFYFSGCPWPPSDGALSPFRAESEH